MLPKENRLKKKKDFERVFKQGKGFKEGFLFIKITRNYLKKSRFGFAVGQKISKKATLRNKIKKRLSELVRTNLAEIKTGFDVVLVANKGLEAEDFWQMEKTLKELFIKAKIWNK